VIFKVLLNKKKIFMVRIIWVNFFQMG